MSDYIAYSESKHPAPHADRVGLVALFYGLFAAPIMWAGNFMVDYGLVSYACYPGRQPLSAAQPGLGFVFWLTLAFYVLTLAVCASGFVVAYRNWAATGQELPGHHHHLIEAGEGRTRYLSMIGMAFSVLFFVASAFGILIYAIEPLCA
jgi:heme/copper-type cytochrome/quinol oxidase subunit 2